MSGVPHSAIVFPHQFANVIFDMLRSAEFHIHIHANIVNINTNIFEIFFILFIFRYKKYRC